MQKIIAGLEGEECQMDHILVFGDTHEQLEQRLEAVLKSIEDNGIRLNMRNANLPRRKSISSGTSSVKMDWKRIPQRWKQ